VVAADGGEARDHLANSLPVLGVTRTFAMYGPCGGGLLARER
jgi:hypothetical protein